MNNYFTTKNSLDMTLVEYNTLKKYFSGIDSLKWAYLEYLKGINLQELIRNKDYQMLHDKVILRNKGGQLLLSKSLPREPIEENIKLKPNSIMFKEKKYSSTQYWNSLLQNTDKLLAKGYIFNLHSQVGEQALLAGSVLLNNIIKNTKNTKSRVTYDIKTGASLDYAFKDFNDYDSSVSKLAKVDILTIFSYNTLSASDFNKAKFESLLDECNIKNTLVILTSKKELKIKDREVINIGFTDTLKKETDLLSDLFTQN